MPQDLFGTDGVRGLAGIYPLDTDGVHHMAMAVASFFTVPGQKIVVGQDTRESSNQIVSDLCAGLNAAGADVVMAGVLPTPGLAYSTRQGEQFQAGVMVTASHNPFQYNGIKVFDSQGNKLSDNEEATLNKLINEEILPKQSGTAEINETLAKRYEDFLVDSAPGLDLSSMRIAIDTANGSASGIAEHVFKRLGAAVTPLFNKPDGRNINDGCGATDTTVLAQRVTDDKLSCGIAFDGDGDRLIIIDSQGREMKGDHLLYILAVTGKHKGVVATVMSNHGLELALLKQDIQLERTAVGDRYVLEALGQTGYTLGGEQSGHIILPDILATGDGLLAAVQVLQAVLTSQKDLAQWRDEVTLLPQALINIPLSDHILLTSPTVQSFIENQSDQLAGNGRLLIRPSGTEPLLRVMVEADNAEAVAEKIASQLQEIIKSETQGEGK